MSDLSETIAAVPIDADKVRELAARGERTTLDFKREDYGWTAAKSANAELAKDLMALANVLGPSSSPAYILIGVQNDGSIVGIPSASHLDDAALHQKVKSLLNRTPQFLYGPVDVDGLSVGVYEISPGGRPYFPLKDAAPSLQKHVAKFRDGTSTETASPAMVLEWHREDDPVGHRLAALELQKREAEAVVHGELRNHSMSTGPEGVTITMIIENTGRSGFYIDSIAWHAEWVVGPGPQHQPAGYIPPGGPIETLRSGIVPPGGKEGFTLSWTALEYFRKNDLHIDGFNSRWFAYHFEVQCHTDLGGVGTLRSIVK